MVPFDVNRVLELGTAWLDRILPERVKCRIFLVGGLYKTLLHGHAPRDLDLFCADDDSRASLLSALRSRGAQTVHDNPPYQVALTLDGIPIDVAYDTTRSSLEEWSASCDLALSAVGCEFSRDGCRAVVHPLAVQSVARREVLLLRPLENWKYALYTLERIYRYAAELGFAVPPEEEDYVWRLFLRQEPSERRAMLRRYLRVSSGSPAIRARAESLCLEDVR